MQDTGKAKIPQFHISCAVQEDICWFDISVQYSDIGEVPMTCLKSTTHLIQNVPYEAFIQKAAASTNGSSYTAKIMPINSISNLA